MRIALMVIRKIYLVPYLFFKLWLAGKRYDGDYMAGFLAAKKLLLMGYRQVILQ